MKTLLIELLIALWTLTSSASWFFCDNNGTSRGQATPQGGDLATMCIGCTHACLAELSTTDTPSFLGNILGKTITARIRITGSSAFASCYNPGSPDIGLLISTDPKPFKLARSQRDEFNYWFHGPSRVNLINAWTMEVTITATVSPSGWSNPNGLLAINHVADFERVAEETKQLYFSIGTDTTFDTGADVATGEATLHLLSVTVN